MSTTYQKCDESISEMAAELLTRFETHKPVLDARVKIDYVFAVAELDAHGFPVSDAITVGGYPALGLCRVIPLKQRAMGRGDVEITLDYFWWDKASPEEREALLDHELHHIAPRQEKFGGFKRDDLGRPKIKLRKHDVDVGWFSVIAARHEVSQERLQAKKILSAYGQQFWPEIMKP